MAYYDNHHHQPRHSRPSAGHPQDYYYPNGGNPHPLDVIPRRDPSDESVEEIPRDYPPGEYYEYGTGYPPHPRRSRVSTVHEGVRRSHSMGGGRSGSGYYDDADYAYRPSRGRRSRHHDDRNYKYSRSPSSSTSRSPPRHHRRRKSFSEQALGALGLGTAAAAGSSSSGRARERSRGRHSRSYSYSPSPTRSSRRSHKDKDSGRGRDRSEQRIASAVKAAVTAGAVEAFRLRKDKGDWTGDKGKRILTAALSAGGTGGLIGSDPEKKSKRRLVESTLAGLATSHLVNGSRSRSRSRHGRGKSKSRVEGLAGAGALAAAGKQAWDAYQKRSRSGSRSGSRSRGRDRSPDDYGGKSSSRRRRSRSVSDYISRGIEALGLDSGPSSKDKDRRSRDYSDDDDYRRRRRRHRSSRYSDDDSLAYSHYSDDDRYGSDYGRRGGRRSRHSKDVGQHHYQLPPSSRPRTHPFYTPTPPQPHTATRARTNPDENNSTDEHEHNTSEDEKTTRNRQKKLTRETILATGLATVATIHAAHGLHESMSKHRENAARVRAGDMSEAEARRRKLRGGLSDAANVGLAALGIKGVVGQWQHADAKRKERATLLRECSVKRERARSRGQGQGQAQDREMFREGLRRRASSYGDVPRRTVYPDEIEEENSFDHHPGGHGYERGRRESSWY